MLARKLASKLAGMAAPVLISIALKAWVIHASQSQVFKKKLTTLSLLARGDQELNLTASSHCLGLMSNELGTRKCFKKPGSGS